MITDFTGPIEITAQDYANLQRSEKVFLHQQYLSDN